MPPRYVKTLSDLLAEIKHKAGSYASRSEDVPIFVIRKVRENLTIVETRVVLIQTGPNYFVRTLISNGSFISDLRGWEVSSNVVWSSEGRLSNEPQSTAGCLEINI